MDYRGMLSIPKFVEKNKGKIGKMRKKLFKRRSGPNINKNDMVDWDDSYTVNIYFSISIAKHG